MSDFLHRLLVRCDTHDEVIVTADEVQQWEAGELDWCLTSGILTATSPADKLACCECGEQSIERIVYLGGEGSNHTQAYLPCPQCGPVRITLEQLFRWVVDLPQLWRILFAGAVSRLVVREVVPRRVWRVGCASGTGGAWDVFVGRLLWRSDCAEILHRVRLSAPSVLFVPDRMPPCEGRTLDQRTFALRDVLTWTGSAATLDFAHVERALAVNQPRRAAGLDRPSRKRAQRAAMIEVLVRLMKEHIEAARDYAHTTAQRGMAELLPRPSQRDLARSSGTTEMAVSRCLRDPAARELRLLWQLAGDLDQLQELPVRAAVRGANS